MMVLQAADDKVIERGETPAAPEHAVVDYRRLLGDKAWNRLPAAIRRRFQHTVIQAVDYNGCFETVESNFAGRCLAYLCRYFGEPLVALVGKNIPALVRVFSEPNGGTVWERSYFFERAPVSTVRSAKRLDRDGGLVECLGWVCVCSSLWRWWTANYIFVATVTAGKVLGCEFPSRKDGFSEKPWSSIETRATVGSVIRR